MEFLRAAQQGAFSFAALTPEPYVATFVVDRFEYTEGENPTLSHGSRKVVAVMVRNAAQFPETGGWACRRSKEAIRRLKW